MKSNVDKDGLSCKDEKCPWIYGGLSHAHKETERPRGFIHTCGFAQAQLLTCF